MTRVEIENQLLYEFRGLSVRKLEETLNFVLFLKHSTHFQPMKSINRPLGLLEGKAKCLLLHDDFKITDEEFLQS
jgi:hypothetical protein